MSGLFLTETWTLFIAHLCQVVHACAAVGMGPLGLRAHRAEPPRQRDQPGGRAV